MVDFIEIKQSDPSAEQIMQIEYQYGVVNVDWDHTHNCINFRINGRISWLYTPDNIIVNDTVVPNITLRQLIKILGFDNNHITIKWAECDCSLWDELIYTLPLCQISVHHLIHPVTEYSLFENGFRPLEIQSF